MAAALEPNRVVEPRARSMGPVSGSMIRVLAVIPGNGRKNSFIFARRQMDSVAKLGLEVDTFYLRSRTSPFALASEVIKLRRRMEKFRPDVLHAQYGTVTSFICAFASSVPLVITFRGSDLSRHPGVGMVRAGIAITLSQLSILRAGRVICVSHDTKNRMWWGRAHAIVLPSGVDLSLFLPCPIEEARARLGWNNDERVVLFCAGTEPKAKGIELIQDAIQVAESIVGHIRLVVLDGSVCPEAVPDYLNASDCLAIASHREGSPNILKEALACNLPVVSVDVGDVRQRLAGDNSSSVVERSPKGFGEALATVLIRKQRSIARETILSLSRDVVDRELVSLYQSIAGSTRRQAPHPSRNVELQ